VAPAHITDAAKVITAKFKNLRRVLKEWQKKNSPASIWQLLMSS
jgi:hypothetical protein